MTIDWTRPIEAEDGTPLVLCQHGMEYGDNTNPDRDGDYWVMREGEVETVDNTACVDADGMNSTRFGRIRNRGVSDEIRAARAQAAAQAGAAVGQICEEMLDEARTIIRDLLAAIDDELGVGSAVAVTRARAFLGEG